MITSVASRRFSSVLRTCRTCRVLHTAVRPTGERSATTAVIPRRTMVVVSQHKADDPLPLTPSKSNPPQTVSPSSKSVDESVQSSATAAQQQDLVITSSCWNRIKQLARKKDQNLEDVYLRVYVDAGGCSGFSYKFELDHEPLEEGEDLVFSHPDSAARVVIDSTSLDLMRGSTIDYVEEMIKSSFEVRNNPQSESACGCGSSFALKNFASNPALD